MRNRPAAPPPRRTASPWLAAQLASLGAVEPDPPSADPDRLSADAALRGLPAPSNDREAAREVPAALMVVAPAPDGGPPVVWPADGADDVVVPRSMRVASDESPGAGSPAPSGTDIHEPMPAMSPGSARLAALASRAQSAPTPGDPVAPGVPEPGGRRSGSPLRAVLVVAVLVALVVAGFGVYSRGLLDGVLGTGGGRQPSSDAVYVYQGHGYSLEAPNTWTQIPNPTKTADVGFVTPSNAQVEVSVSDPLSGPMPELSDPAGRRAVFDTLIRVIQARYPGSVVVSRTDTTLGGLPGEHIALAGSRPFSGEPFRDDAVIAVSGARFFSIELVGSPAVTTDPVTAVPFTAMAASFRIND
jgi:hypothetical protein